MKIVKLVAENVKRLHAVEITPEGSLITIGGKNNAGKSSVLDAIAYAMGGQQLVPAEPIRTGESEAKIVVDLGELTVTRRFKRVKLPCECADCNEKRKTDNHDPKCPNRTKWGETSSTLVVTNKDGFKASSPQAVLDKLLGRLTFDPLVFARDSETSEGRKKQAETLRNLVGIDFEDIDDRRDLAYVERTSLKKQHAVKEAQLLAMPKHVEAPAEEIPLAEISAEMLRAEELRTLAEEAERAVYGATTKTTEAGASVQRLEAIVRKIEQDLADQKALLEDRRKQVREALAHQEAVEIVAKTAREAVPDTATLRERLGEVEATNAKVRANVKRKDEEIALDQLAAQIHRANEGIQAADDAKRAALAAAKFPVEGLGLSDDGVTFNGLPFAQAGAAEQVRVSVAIGIALNPKLRVLMIRNGNLLDADSLAAVAAQAETAGMQVWVEWVSSTGDGVAVMLVDGEVAS